MRIGDQIAEVYRAHHPVSKRECRERSAEFLERVRLHRRVDAFRAYPHELSGGERHRVVIAQALVCGPRLVIADEPTAGLDAALQSEILDLIAELRGELQVSFLLISHDHAMLARLCDRTLKMSAGELTPAAPESRRRIAGFTRITQLNAHSSEAPLVQVCGISKSYQKRGVLFREKSRTQILRNVNLSIPHDSTVALIGESGSGKSTLARCLAMWERPDAGEIIVGGRNLTGLSATERRQLRSQVQLVLQDSAAAFNPNLTAEQIVEEPLLIQNRGHKQSRQKRVHALLEEIGFERVMFQRKPLEFSGGQRQRLAIARALMLEPQLVIFDESTSGLDSETQRQILALLAELKRSRRLSYLLISHDLRLVRDVADSILMMQDGAVVELSQELVAIGKFPPRAASAAASSAALVESR
jgi:ABC-type glutathione transport system ATPase component